MFVQKVPHIKDQFLTQERASMELESGQIAVVGIPTSRTASLLYTLTRIMSLYCPGGQQRALFCGRQHL